MEQQLDRNTALRVAYVGSFGYHGLLSIDPNTIPAQICANAAGCARPAATGTAQRQRAAGRAVHSGRNAAESVSGRGILLVHRRQQQLQRAANRRDAAPEPGSRSFAPTTPGRRTWT